MLDSRPKGRGFEPHRRHCVVSLSKNINPSLVLVQPRKTRPFITERLLMGRKESNQTNKTNNHYHILKIADEVIRTMAASNAFQSIVLRESDVPGAKLVYESIEKHSNIQLQRWLECRGLAKTGNRSKLIQR